MSPAADRQRTCCLARVPPRRASRAQSSAASAPHEHQRRTVIRIRALVTAERKLKRPSRPTLQLRSDDAPVNDIAPMSVRHDRCRFADVTYLRSLLRGTRQQKRAPPRASPPVESATIAATAVICTGGLISIPSRPRQSSDRNRPYDTILRSSSVTPMRSLPCGEPFAVSRARGELVSESPNEDNRGDV